MAQEADDIPLSLDSRVYRLGRDVSGLSEQVKALSESYKRLATEMSGLRSQIWLLILAAIVGPIVASLIKL